MHASVSGSIFIACQVCVGRFELKSGGVCVYVEGGQNLDRQSGFAHAHMAIASWLAARSMEAGGRQQGDTREAAGVSRTLPA